MKRISILGSTGSIGVSTLDVVARHPDKFRVVGLAAGRNLDRLSEQVKRFSPSFVSVQHEEDIKSLKERLGGNKVEILSGDGGACAVASESSDIVVSAIVGAAGLKSTFAAVRAGRNIALANKESMVIAGKIMTDEAAKKGTKIVPIDSEHSAIFQALNGNRRRHVRRLILTASGGPFFQKDVNLEKVSPKDALKHPNWEMGRKITIDSASMMNKGLEIIEASWLFGIPIDKVQVLIHPQSVVHSMVEYIDGSVIAQMGVPDMRVAIAYALTYPERVETGVPYLDLAGIQSLTFYSPDNERFPALKLAYEAGRIGGTMPAIFNAANEIAVEKFLGREISFTAIPRLVEETMNKHKVKKIETLEDVLDADRWARETSSLVARRSSLAKTSHESRVTSHEPRI